MELTEITIQNYRSFHKKSTFKINGTYNIVIGENNAGKSNIFKALELMVRLFKYYNFPSAYDSIDFPDKEDFSLNNLNNPIRIELKIQFNKDELRHLIEDFNKQLNNINRKQQFLSFFDLRDELLIGEQIFSQYIIIILLYRYPNKGTIYYKSNNLCFDERSSFSLSEKPFILGSSRKTYDNYSKLSDTVRISIGKINFRLLIDKVIDFMDSIYIIKDIRQRPIGKDISEKNLLDGTGIINFLFNSANGDLETKNKWNHFREIFNKLFQEYEIDVFQTKDGNERDLHIYSSKNHHITQINSDSFEIPLNNVGTGVLEWIIFLTNIIYSNNKLFVIEEPEIHLHPNEQQRLQLILKKNVMENNNKFIIITHSPYFIDLGSFDQIIMVRNENYSSTCHQISIEDFISDIRNRRNIETDPERLMLEYYNAFQFTGDSEIAKSAFFAKKIILVEGSSDVYILNYFFEKLGYDYIGRGIHILKCGGKSELDRFYRLYTEFGIPCYVVFDGDYHIEIDEKKSDKEKESNKTLNRDLQELLKGSLEEINVEEFPNDVPHERFLGFNDTMESVLGFPNKEKKGLKLFKKVKNKFDNEENLPEWIISLKEKINTLQPLKESILKKSKR